MCTYTYMYISLGFNGHDLLGGVNKAPMQVASVR